MRKVRNILKSDYLMISIISINLIVGFVFLPFLKNEIAVHWVSNNIADGYLPKLIGVFFVPIIALLIYCIFELIPLILSKSSDRYQLMTKHRFGMYVVELIFLALQIYILVCSLIK